MMLVWNRIVACWIALWFVPYAVGQTTINGGDLALRSTGSSQIQSTGYVGTYLSVPDSGDGGASVSLTLNATRGFGSGNPHVNLVVADSKFSFDVTQAGAQDYITESFWMPAGTHFVRVERDSPGNTPAQVNRSLTINSLSTAGSTFNNTNNTSNALAAANSYIEHFRQGNAMIYVSGSAPGTEVQVRQIRHDFNFGTAVAGSNLAGVNNMLNNANYRDRLLENFNTIVPENAGKWDSSTLPNGIQAVDAMMQFAEDHNLNVRMHNLIWQSQQPSNINTLISQASGGNATAKAQLRQEITNRIGYYVGDRAHRYGELDVLNEALRAPAYWNIFTPTEIAGIYAEVRDAAAAAGADVGLYANDYNILQHNSNPQTGQADAYANWHRNHAEQLNNAGYGEVVSGIGIQYYVRHDGSVSVPRIQQVFQNMGVTGLPLTLTEFGVQTFGSPTPAQSANYLEDTMRMVFGTPHATTFMMWGFWEGAIWSGGPNAALYDLNWDLTIPGARYQQLMDDWTTEDTVSVSADGTINFRGFYGDYEITIGDQTYLFSLKKNSPIGSIVTAPGDYNADGIVDAADYIVWRNSLGSTTELWADGNGDRVVDEADYIVWAANLGISYENGGGSSVHGRVVPEPSTGMLVLLAIVVCAGTRRKTQ